MRIAITPTLSIDDQEIQEVFVRSSGPGGQNVNKVSTAVQLRFDVARSPSLPHEVRQRLLAASDKRMSADGVLLISASRFRSREQNRKDALERLVRLIRQATIRPKRRRPTRPTQASRRRRLTAKRHRSLVKTRRGRPDRGDDS